MRKLRKRKIRVMAKVVRYNGWCRWYRWEMWQ